MRTLLRPKTAALRLGRLSRRPISMLPLDSARKQAEPLGDNCASHGNRSANGSVELSVWSEYLFA